MLSVELAIFEFNSSEQIIAFIEFYLSSSGLRSYYVEFLNMGNLKIIQVCVKSRVWYFYFLWNFPWPWKHQQTLLALHSLHWASPVPACRLRTRFRSAWGSLSLCFATLPGAISLAPSPFASYGIPSIWIWGCWWTLLQALSLWNSPWWWGYSLHWIIIDSHALRLLLALATTWHQILISGLVFIFCFKEKYILYATLQHRLNFSWQLHSAFKETGRWSSFFMKLFVLFASVSDSVRSLRCASTLCTSASWYTV